MKTIYQMTEGLEVRMQSAAKKATSFEEFVTLVKTKRYTWTRIQRLACYVLLNIHHEEIHDQQAKCYLNILGFTKAGQQFLKEKKEIPLISKIGKKKQNWHTFWFGVIKSINSVGRYLNKILEEDLMFRNKPGWWEQSEMTNLNESLVQYFEYVAL